MKLSRIGFALLLVLGLVGLAQAVVLTGTNNSNQAMVLKAGFFRMSVQDAMTALVGGAQGGTALASGYNRFTTVTSSGDSAQLPSCLAGGAPDAMPPANSDGLFLMVTNAATPNSMNVYPQSGQSINALGANAAYAVAANKTVMFICSPSGLIWYSLLGG